MRPVVEDLVKTYNDPEMKIRIGMASSNNTTTTGILHLYHDDMWQSRTPRRVNTIPSLSTCTYCCWGKPGASYTIIWAWGLWKMWKLVV